MPYRSVNPATGEVLKAFPEHTDEQMWSALTKADKAFRAWAARPFSERSKTIARAAQPIVTLKEPVIDMSLLKQKPVITRRVPYCPYVFVDNDAALARRWTQGLNFGRIPLP